MDKAIWAALLVCASGTLSIGVLGGATIGTIMWAALAGGVWLLACVAWINLRGSLWEKR